MSRLHRIDLTGDYNTTIYIAARALLDGGLAKPDDRIETCRNGRASMSMRVGDCLPKPKADKEEVA